MGMAEKYIFQGVGMLFQGNFSELSWGKNEKRECRFVFIGRNLDRKELIDGVNACRVDNKPLRFAVGDPVLANVGKWTPGHILKQWDNGNPYRIQLDNAKKSNVWGPLGHPKLWLVDLLGELRLESPLLVDLVLMAQSEVVMVGELGNLVDRLAVACGQTGLQGHPGRRCWRKMESQLVPKQTI